MLRLHPHLKASFVASIDNKDRLDAELARHAPTGDGDDFRKRMDLLLLGEHVEGGASWNASFEREKTIAVQFVDVYKRLLKVSPTYERVSRRANW